MTPPFSPRTSDYLSEIFDPSRLSSLESIEQATYEFQAIIRKDTLVSILENLLEDTNTNLLPLALCCLDQQQQSWVLDLVPDRIDIFPGSLSQRLISKLSRFFLAATPFLSHCSPPASREQEIEAVNNVLVELATIEFASDASTNKNKVSQRDLKKQRRANARSRAINPQPFKILNVSIPTNPLEVEELKSLILTQQKSLLQSYLEAICSEDLALGVKGNCIVLPSEPASESFSEKMEELEVTEESPTTGLVQSVYPKVQPMKSALRFDSPEGFGDWLIIISDSADRELRFRHKKEKKTFDIIVKKIKELSHGHLSPDNHKRLNRSGSDAVVFEAKMTNDLRLVYQVDLVPHFDGRMCQAFKIFGIFTHAQLDDRLWDTVGRNLTNRSKEYREKCAIRLLTPNADDHTFSPAVFPPLAEVSTCIGVANMLVDESNIVHSRFLMGKYVALHKPLMNTMLADLDVAFPHEISAQEERIVTHPNSCYVVGRSGTGKTTTLLFKMLIVDHLYQLAEPGTPKPRQLFVTRSRILAQKVKEYHALLTRGLHAARTTCQDELVGLTSSIPLPELDDATINVNDIQDWYKDLPERFSQLEDRHFPLFISYTALCDLLEADVAITDRKAVARVDRTSVMAKRVNLTIDFEQFKRKYWSRLPEPLTKKIDSSLAFSELIGVIKGSEATLSLNPHFLSEDAYCKVSDRRQGTIALNKGEMYSLFEAYLKKKREEGGEDIADRTHNILDHFSQFGVPGQKIDHLYVDEVQDNLLIDTLVLRALCINSDGLFWAGDTAQAISAGSSFSFNELRAFQWRLEEKRALQTNSAGVASGSSLPATKTEIFQLAVNHRSHAGIVNCAHSVIDLINLFWPGSIDYLVPEVGEVAGPRPIFLVGKGNHSFILNDYLFGSSGNRVEFGADQCILVRDEEARTRLIAEMGNNIGLVLTIYQSKGLEFNDVLLYDFFQDSDADFARWRVVLNAIDKYPVPLPKFDYSKHASIWLELKFLYVAITRARENVWIADVSSKGEAMREYWNSRGLIRNLTPGIDAPKLARGSTPQEWFEQGKELFQHNEYRAAKHCFERADKPDHVFMAHSYILYDLAEGLVHPHQRKQAFHEAGVAFQKCSGLFPTRRFGYLVKSADCFYQAQEFLVAAGLYVETKQHDAAVDCYRTLRMFDEAVKIVTEHKESLNPDLVDEIIRKAKFFYFSTADSLSVSDPKRKWHIAQGIKLFEDAEDPVEYLEDRLLDGVRGDVLVTLSRFSEAAEIQWSEGKHLQAIELFLQDQRDLCSRRAGECILEALWQELPFGHRRQSDDTDSVVSRLLDLSTMLNGEFLDAQRRAELPMFQILSSHTPDKHTLREMGRAFLANQNLPAGLLCLDHYLDSSPLLRNYDISLKLLAEELELFLHFVELLTSQVGEQPADAPESAKLFGYKRLSDGTFHVSSQSPLSYRHTQQSGTDRTKGTTSLELRSSIKNIVFTRLGALIRQINEECKNIKVFSLCLPYTRVGHCNRTVCPRAHVQASDIDDDYYTLRVRTHLQQVLLISRMRYTSLYWHDQRRYWLARLYEALHPPHHTMGGLSGLLADQMPEVQKDQIGRIRYWVEEFIYSHNFFYSQKYFLSLLLRGVILVVDTVPSFYSLAKTRTLVHNTEALRYLHRGFRSIESTTPPEFIRVGGSNIVRDLISVLEGSVGQSLVAGIFAIRHIIQRKISIEISLLCDVLDNLCRSLILARFCSYNGPNIHGMTLPRSWLMSPINVERYKQTAFGFFNFLIEPMTDLLAQIYTGKDAAYLLFEASNLSLPLPGTIRSVFITRICRALALIGYNYKNEDLREKLISVFSSLKELQPPPPLNASYRWYVYSDTWGGIINTVRRSGRESRMDGMVELLHSTRLRSEEPLWEITGVRRIVYDKLEHVPHLLRQSETTSERPTAGEFVIPEETDNDQEEDQVEAQIENDVDDDILDAPVASQSVGEEAEVNVFTEQELEIVSKLPAIYRSRRARQKFRSAMAERRNEFFLSCLEVSKASKPGKYRKLMLGPLPHLLSCLDAVYARLLKLRKTTKELKLNTIELDVLEAQLTSTNTAIKKVICLQKALSPTSQLHSACSEKQLEQYACDVKGLLFGGIPVDLTEEMKREFELGWKGAVGRNIIHPEQPEKPKLNTSDLYEFEM